MNLRLISFCEEPRSNEGTKIWGVWGCQGEQGKLESFVSPWLTSAGANHPFTYRGPVQLVTPVRWWTHPSLTHPYSWSLFSSKVVHGLSVQLGHLYKDHCWSWQHSSWEHDRTPDWKQSLPWWIHHHEIKTKKQWNQTQLCESGNWSSWNWLKTTDDQILKACDWKLWEWKNIFCLKKPHSL